jgi:hypothetical protein
MIAECPRQARVSPSLLKQITEGCVVDECDGMLYCKKCLNRVVVDYFEQSLECQGCDEL